MRFHFLIKASFEVDTEGWYCVTKGNISFSSLLLCFRRADSLSVNSILDRKKFWFSQCHPDFPMKNAPIGPQEHFET